MPSGPLSLSLILAFSPGLKIVWEGSTTICAMRDSGGMAMSRASSCTLPALDRETLDEDVRHVARDDADLLDCALALQADDLGGEVNAV